MNRLWILGTATLALSCAAFGQTHTHKARHKHASKMSSFERWYRAETPTMERAMEKGDVSFFDKISSDDFTYTMDGQTSNKKDSLDQMKQMFGKVKKISYHYKPTSFKVDGDMATVTGSESMTAWMKPGPDKKKHVMRAKGKTVEAWKMVDGKWLITSITENGSKMTMDGKPMDMSQMGGGGNKGD